MVTKLIFFPNQYVEWILAFLEKSDFDYWASTVQVVDHLKDVKHVKHLKNMEYLNNVELIKYVEHRKDVEHVNDVD